MKIQGKEKSLPNIEHLLDFLTDNSTRLLHTRVLKSILCEIGDRLSEEEFSFLMQHFLTVDKNNASEEIDYKKLLKYLTFFNPDDNSSSSSSLS